MGYVLAVTVTAPDGTSLVYTSPCFKASDPQRAAKNVTRKLLLLTFDAATVRSVLLRTWNEEAIRWEQEKTQKPAKNLGRVLIVRLAKIEERLPKTTTLEQVRRIRDEIGTYGVSYLYEGPVSYKIVP